MDGLAYFYVFCIVATLIAIVYNYFALKRDKREAGIN